MRTGRYPPHLPTSRACAGIAEKPMDPVTYSIVIPLYNEEKILPLLVERLQEIMAQLDGTAEVVMVDDGSSDRTYPLAQAAAAQDPRFKAIQFSRNFGH